MKDLIPLQILKFFNANTTSGRYQLTMQIRAKVRLGSEKRHQQEPRCCSQCRIEVARGL